MTIPKNEGTAYLDIETSPCFGWFWWTGKQYVGPDNVLEEPKIIMVSVKYGGDSKVKTFVWDPKTRNDDKLLEDLSTYLNGAVEVVAYNGANFDIRWINARIAKHGLPPLCFNMLEDIMKPVKAKLRLVSYKLDYLAKFFKVPGKLKHSGLEMWLKICLEDDRESLKEMQEYCEQDVKLLEQVHLRVMPYIPRSRNLTMEYGHAMSCRHCGGNQVVPCGDYYRGAVTYRRFRCLDCEAGRRYCGVLPLSQVMKKSKKPNYLRG
jgi:hypothetical protein